MMSTLNRDYYVALLSAAAVHKAHQSDPAILQVMCAPSMRSRRFRQVQLSFMTRSHVAASATVTCGNPSMRVATPEVTALDMVERPALCGGLARVAEILGALGELDGGSLAADAARNRGRAMTRRAGWMIERFGRCAELDGLRRVAQRESDSAPLLEPRCEHGGYIDRSWGVRINADPQTCFEHSDCATAILVETESSPSVDMDASLA
jgi:predicted transcriptional regulator of viral defense system